MWGCRGIATELYVVCDIGTGHGHLLGCDTCEVVGHSGRGVSDGTDVPRDVSGGDFLGTGVDALPAENVSTVVLTNECGYSLVCGVCGVCVCVHRCVSYTDMYLMTHYLLNIYT